MGAGRRLAGSVFQHWRPLTRFSGGLLTILGIATLNGIMMISHFQHLEEEEGMTFGQELVMRSARERSAPIMITALTIRLALIPLAITGDLAGHEIEHPMALVILGGLGSIAVSPSPAGTD